MASHAANASRGRHESGQAEPSAKTGLANRNEDSPRSVVGGKFVGDIADVKNVGSRYGGAITAGMFLEKFVDDTPWAHIDIAGPTFIEKGGEFYPKGATGFGVQTILQYLLER